MIRDVVNFKFREVRGMVMRRVRGVVREIRGMVHFNFRRVRGVVIGRVRGVVMGRREAWSISTLVRFVVW